MRRTFLFLAVLFSALSLTAQISTPNTSCKNQDNLTTPFQPTWSHIVASGQNFLLVSCQADSGTLANRSVSTMTYNGTTMTKIASSVIDATPNRSEVWYLNSPTVGTANIVATFGGGAGGITCEAWSMPGVDVSTGTSAIDSVTTTNVATTPVNATTTTVANNAWLFSGILVNSSALGGTGHIDPNSTPNQTRSCDIVDTTDGITAAGGYRGPITPAGSATESWTAAGSTANTVMSLVSIKPAAAGAAANPKKPLIIQ
jgi:hypothetical protein